VRLELNLDGRIWEVDFAADGGSARLVHAGQTYEAEVSEPEPGHFTVIINRRVYRCSLDRLPGGQTEAVVNGHRFPVSIRDPKRSRGGAGAGAAAGGRATLTAPMPGKIVRVMCAVGDEVRSGQGLAVVEAMKMQNEVQSPKDGQVVELRVAEGQTVNAGETMVVIE